MFFYFYIFMCVYFLKKIGFFNIIIVSFRRMNGIVFFWYYYLVVCIQNFLFVCKVIFYSFFFLGCKFCCVYIDKVRGKFVGVICFRKGWIKLKRVFICLGLLVVVCGNESDLVFVFVVLLQDIIGFLGWFQGVELFVY